MGKTRDLLKKIRDTKGTFHAKMGSIKDRNGMDLREAEDIKKRWQEHTEAPRWPCSEPTHHSVDQSRNKSLQAPRCPSTKKKKKKKGHTEELYKKDLHDPDNHDDVITHLEPDILECEVK